MMKVRNLALSCFLLVLLELRSSLSKSVAYPTTEGATPSTHTYISTTTVPAPKYGFTEESYSPAAPHVFPTAPTPVWDPIMGTFVASEHHQSKRETEDNEGAGGDADDEGKHHQSQRETDDNEGAGGDADDEVAPVWDPVLNTFVVSHHHSKRQAEDDGEDGANHVGVVDGANDAMVRARANVGNRNDGANVGNRNDGANVGNRNVGTNVGNRNVGANVGNQNDGANVGNQNDGANVRNRKDRVKDGEGVEGNRKRGREDERKKDADEGEEGVDGSRDGRVRDRPHEGKGKFRAHDRPKPVINKPPSPQVACPPCPCTAVPAYGRMQHNAPGLPQTDGNIDGDHEASIRTRRSPTSDDYWHKVGSNNEQLMAINAGYRTQVMLSEHLNAYAPPLHVGTISGSDFNYPADFKAFGQPGFKEQEISANIIYDLLGPVEMIPVGSLVGPITGVPDVFSKLVFSTGKFRLLSIVKSGIMTVANVDSKIVFNVDCNKQMYGGCQNFSPIRNSYDYPRFHPVLGQLIVLLGQLDATQTADASATPILLTSGQFTIIGVTSPSKFSIRNSVTNKILYVDCRRQVLPKSCENFMKA